MNLMICNNDSYLINQLSNKKQHPIHWLPDELILEIFSHLSLDALAITCCINKEWKRLACEPISWKIAIYRELAFGHTKWAECFGSHVVKNENKEEEFLSLPLSIVEEYKKFQRVFPNEKAKDHLMLVRLPKTLGGQLSLKNFGELAKKYFSNSVTGYKEIRSDIVVALGDKPIDKSRWVLMTTDVLPGSRNKSYDKQQEVLQKTLIEYEIPETLEATVCILAQYFNSGIRLFNSHPETCTRCKDIVDGYQTAVGIFHSDGLIINNSYHNSVFYKIGVAALKKL